MSGVAVPSQALSALPLELPAEAGVLMLPDASPLPPAQRLLVLVPDADVDETQFAGLLWSLAKPQTLPVLLLGTPRRPDEQFRAQRRLSTLAAFTCDRTVHVTTALMLDAGWLEAVRRLWQPGDLVICPSELLAGPGPRHRPLAQALARHLRAPIYVADGFYPGLPPEANGWLGRLGAWLPPLAIVLGFMVLQTRLVVLVPGGWQTVLMVATVILEFGLIAAWERYLGTLL